MTDQPQNNNWENCPPGLLQRIAQRSRRRQRLQTMRKVFALASAVCVCSVLIGLIFFSNPVQPLPSLGGLTCDETAGLIFSYQHESLPQEMMARIERHVQNCPNCGQAFAETISQVGSLPSDTRLGRELAAAASPTPGLRR